MAKTAVVNPKRRKRAKGRTRRYGSARRRRRNPASTTLSGARRRRRRNPSASIQSAYSSGGYRRRPNPRRRARRRNPGADFQGMLDRLMEIAPPAVAGVQLARAALKMGGAFEPLPTNPSGGPAGLAPTVKHALFGVLAAEFGGKLIGDVMGSAAKGEIAMHACIGFIGDVFLHKRFLVGNQFAADNLYLGDWEPDEQLGGFSDTSAIGDADPQFVVDETGRMYQLGESVPGDPQRGDLATLNLSGFSNTSAIGSVESSFGYVPR